MGKIVVNCVDRRDCFQVLVRASAICMQRPDPQTVTRMERQENSKTATLRSDHASAVQDQEESLTPAALSCSEDKNL